jgi:hypothetical protein
LLRRDDFQQIQDGGGDRCGPAQQVRDQLAQGKPQCPTRSRFAARADGARNSYLQRDPETGACLDPELAAMAEQLMRSE